MTPPPIKPTQDQLAASVTASSSKFYKAVAAALGLLLTITSTTLGYVIVIDGNTNGSAAPPTTTSTMPTPVTTAPSPVTTVPPTTAPPTTTTVPSSGKPSLANTGVPAGVTLTPTAGFTASTNGQVFDRLDVSGTITINANNVTIKRSRVRGAGFYTIRTSDGFAGTRIEDSEVDCLGVAEGANGIAGGPTTVVRTHVHGCENDVTPQSGNWTITDNLLDGLKAPGSPHYDTIQIDGGQSNILIRHNTIVNDYGQTAAVMIDNYFGPIDGITVDDNWMSGGGYTQYVDGQFGGGPIKNVRITNNRISGWVWGCCDFNQASPVFTGNVDGAGRPL